jgi:hypothetical protein
MTTTVSPESRFVELARWLLIPILVVAGISLPPFSLGSRLLQAGFTLIGEGRNPIWSMRDPDGAQVTVPEQPLGRKLRIRLSSVPRLNFLEGITDEYLLPAVAALPSDLVMKSPLYEVQRRGAPASDVLLTLPIPNDAEPHHTLDLYAWDGETWNWVPSILIGADEVIVARLETLPEMIAFAMMQTLPPHPVVAVNLSSFAVLPADAGQILSEISPIGAYLDVNGSLSLPAELAAQGAWYLPFTTGATTVWCATT